MSIIQRIREKGALISAIIIAVSLLGFILMDAFAGRTGLFSGSGGTTVGKVDGTKIEYQDFVKRVDATEAYQRQQGYDQGEVCFFLRAVNFRK